jgi:hypothetical protein
MFKKLFFYCLQMILVSTIICSSCTKKVTIKSLIKEMVVRENLSYFPQKQFTHRQFSSYNRASVSPDKEGWYANYDMSHFLRVEEQSGRREFVMFDADGPGAIVRWWMTFYKAQNGVLRIYLDNDTNPVIKGAPDQLLSGTLLTGPPLAVSVQAGAPPGEEGRDYDHNFYVPIPFAQHCKITYECDSLVLRYENEGVAVPQGYYWPDVFYNIGYRAYTKDIQVESASPEALEAARPLLNDAGKTLLGNQVNSESEEDFEKLILPGDSLVIEFTKNGYAVNRLMIEMKAPNMPQSLRSAVLRASFDGYQTIWAPIGEFFGSGYSLNPHKTWMNQRDEKGRMESFWVMPFREKCKISIINYSTENISFKGLAGLAAYKWNMGSMYFGASWHEYYHIKTRSEDGSPFDLNFIDISGKGVYVGDQVTLFNNTYHWWGEGDEKIFVDGESFPSSFGTGSEDYYGYSFARQESFSHPFISQPTGIGNMNWGVTVNMRHRSLDAIPFSTSISSNVELWHWASVRMNYALTTYYYILPPYTKNIDADIESVKRQVVLSKIDFTLDEK